MTRRNHRCRRDDGAVLVEFAIIAPLLFAILFGIIEFGWGYAQYLDARHGAREGARLAAVDYSDPTISPPSTGATQTQQILEEVCERMGGDVNSAMVTLAYDNTANTDLGDRASINVTAELDTLTGFLDFALGGVQIEDDISFRLERDSSWTDGNLTC